MDIDSLCYAILDAVIRQQESGEAGKQQKDHSDEESGVLKQKIVTAYAE